MDLDDDDDVFWPDEIQDQLEEELWSSPLMNYRSPFDDYKDLFKDIGETSARHSSSRLPVPIENGRFHDIMYYQWSPIKKENNDIF